MKNSKKWMALLLSAAISLNTGLVSVRAQVDQTVAVAAAETDLEHQANDRNSVPADGDAIDDGQKGSGKDEVTGDGTEAGQEEHGTDENTADGGQDETEMKGNTADDTPGANETGEDSADVQAASETEASSESTERIKELSTLEDLLEFANNINVDGYTYRNETVVLLNDIDASSIEWTPIGEMQWTGFGNPVSKAFMGNFDGQGHSITINVTGERVGLFLAFQYGTIENLTIEGRVHITKFGGGAFCYQNQGTIKNCVNKATIINASDITAKGGGIAGSNYLASSPYYCTQAGEIINCANYGTVNGSGIAASNSTKSTISGCFNAGTVSEAGIVGQNSGLVECCYNVGTVTNDTDTVGGIVRHSSYANVQRCYNVGKIDGAEGSGAIAVSLSEDRSFRNYYLEGTASVAIGETGVIGDVKTEAELKSADIVKKKYLGTAYKVNPNNGYPLLTWQTSNGTEKLLTLSDLKVVECQDGNAKVTFTAGMAGEVYYLVQPEDAEAPEAAAIAEQGQKTEAVNGTNELSLGGLGEEAQKLYLILKDGVDSSSVYSIALENAFLEGALDSLNGSVSFDGAAREMTLVYDTDITRFGFKVQLSEAAGTTTEQELKLVYSYRNVLGEEKSVEGSADGHYVWFNEDFLAVSAEGNDMTITATKGDSTQTYVLHVVRRAVLGGLELTDQNGRTLSYTPAFTKSRTEYELTVLDTVSSVTFTVKEPTAAEPTMLFNDTEVTGNTYTQEILNGLNTVVIKAANGASEQRGYTVKITRQKAILLSVKTEPENAFVALYQDNTRVWPVDGVFPLSKDTVYTYTASAKGYVSQTGTVSISQSEKLNITLERAPETEELPQLDADYPSFRSGEDNMSVVSAKTPVTKDSLEVKWERQMGDYAAPTSGTTPILVDGKIYTLSGTSLYMLDKDTGEVLKKATTVTDPGFGLIPPTYGDGMLFVPLSDGTIQCFNAQTLESLWVYEDPLKGRCENSIRYDNGYIYTGFFTNPANFVCISVEDEDPSNMTEKKIPVWRNSSLGSFYWDGCWTNENYIFVVSNAGTLYCLDKRSGDVMQRYVLSEQTRCNISYYNNRIYLATQGGSIYSFNLTKEGMLDTENLIAPLKFGGASTSTPAVYNNRIYIGLTHGQSFGTEGFEILVADINPQTGAMTTAYTVETDGYVQTSGLICNAYEKEDGYVYVYFLANSAHGTLYMIKDKAGLKEADPASGALYIPNHEQYCIASVVADKEGCLYVKNDSAWQFALKIADVYLKGINLTGGNAVLDGGEDYDGSLKEHLITVDPGTVSLKMELETTEETDVYINGIPGGVQEISLADGAAEVKVELRKGETVRSYKFRVVSGPVLKSLRVDNSVNEGSTFNLEDAVLDPEYAYMTTEYTAGFETAQNQAVIWANPLNSRDTVTIKAVSGCSVGLIKTNNRGNTWYQLYLAEKVKPTVAKVVLTVTSEDGSQSRDYYITVYTQNALPLLNVGENALKERTDTSAKVEYSVNKEGELYYLVQAADAAAPDAAAILANEQKTEAKAGTNTLNLSGLEKKEQKLYMVLKDTSGAESAVKSIEIPGVGILGDVNGDGSVNIADVAMLLDLVTAGETVDRVISDINGDGHVNIADVAKLLDLVTAGEI